MKIKDFYFVKLAVYIYRRFFEEHPLVFLLIVSVILNLLSWGIVSIKGRPENFLIPLHYLVLKGVDKTGPWYFIYQIPLAGLIILAMNFFLAFSLKKKDIKASYLIASATIILMLFFIIASYLIVFRV